MKVILFNKLFFFLFCLLTSSISLGAQLGSGEFFIVACGLKTRTQASLEAPVVRYFKLGDIVSLKGLEDKWGKISDNEYISFKYLREIPLGKGLSFAKAESDKIAINCSKAVFSAKTTQNTSSLITNDQDQRAFVVTSSFLRVRSGPSMKFPAISYLKSGDKIKKITLENRIWIKIEENKYVSKKHLKSLSVLVSKTAPANLPPRIAQPLPSHGNVISLTPSIVAVKQQPQRIFQVLIFYIAGLVLISFVIVFITIQLLSKHNPFSAIFTMFLRTFNIFIISLIKFKKRIAILVSKIGHQPSTSEKIMEVYYRRIKRQ